MRTLGALLSILLVTGTTASSQFRFFEGENISVIAQPPGIAVSADITTTLTAQTPWGPFVHTETGKYWRSRNGKLRQDNSYGLSTVVDLGRAQRSSTTIDYQLQRIDQTVLGRPGEEPRRSRTVDHTGKDFTFLDHEAGPKPQKTGESVLDGFKVTIRGGIWEEYSYEIWTADELKLILLFKVTTDTSELVQRYSNIRLAEPDPSLFELPPGFQMVRRFPDPYSPQCTRHEVSVSGEPEILDVDRFPCPGFEE